MGEVSASRYGTGGNDGKFHTGLKNYLQGKDKGQKV